jgi:subtilisin family serine protease
VLYLKIRNDVSLELRTVQSVQDESLAREFKTYRAYALRRPYKVLKTKRFDRWYEVRFAETTKVDAFVKALKQIKIVETAEKVPANRTMQLIPNDPFAQASMSGNPSWQYALDRIRAYHAFQIHQGGGARVAVVDDAVRYTHPDLLANVWTNPGEVPGNGIDDDNNGYVDDVHGYDVADNDPDPLPPATANSTTFAHGTHCGGIAGAVTDNSTGMASIGFDNQLIAVKTASSTSANPGQLDNPYEGVAYAVATGARVISMSWGGTFPSQLDYEVIEHAYLQGIVLVAAAGNDNNDVAHYPAAYGSPGTFQPSPVNPSVGFPNTNLVMAVAATDNSDHKAGFSCFGDWVDVSAPGRDIHSTVPLDSYTLLSGTSMACPLVAGLGGLMRSYSPALSNNQIINCLRSTADDIYQLAPNTPFQSNSQLGSGRINAQAALQCLCLPAFAVNNLQVTGPGGAALPLQYMAGTAYTFVASASASSGSLQYQWFINGTAAGTGTQLVHTFAQPGTYSIRVTVSNGSSLSCTDEQVFNVAVLCPLNVGFTASATFVQLGGTVTLANTSTGNPAGTTYSWTLDGTPVTLAGGNTLTLTSPGLAVISLIASHPTLGCTRTTAQSVSVGQCSLQALEARHWRFGNLVGLDFYPATGTGPVQVPSTILSTVEGSASVSDAGGNLVLVSNGVFLGNALGQSLLPTAGPVPPAGAVVSQLLGSHSSTQSVVILPHPNPANQNIYYVITSGVIGSQTDGVNLYTVDMNTPPGQLIYGPLQIIAPFGMEGIAATRHCSGRDYWVAGYDFNTRSITTFAITQSIPLQPALNDIPIIQHPNIFTTTARTYLKFSPSGSLLGIASSGAQSGGAVYAFNNATGTLGAIRRNLAIGQAGLSPYAMEFSPDEQQAYVTSDQPPSQLTQFSLTQPNLPPFVMQNLWPANAEIGGIQLGPDRRIYVTGWFTTAIGVIANPNGVGAACGFNANAIPITPPSTLSGGFPSLVSSAFTQGEATISGPTALCLTPDVVVYSGPRNCVNATYQWTIVSGNATTAYGATDADVGVRFNGSGPVVLRLAYTTPCGTMTAEQTIQVNAPATPVAITPAAPAVCVPSFVGLSATPGMSAYQWSTAGATFSTSQNIFRNIQSVPQVFTVTATDQNGCTSQASATVTGSMAGNPTCSLSPVISACRSFAGLPLDAGLGTGYTWDDGSTGRTRTIFNSGTYWVDVTDHCGATITCSTQVDLAEVQILQAQASPATCNAANGSIQLQVQGGTAPYTYGWSNGSTQQNGLPALTGLSPGNYHVWVEDASGCRAEQNVVVGGAASSLAITVTGVTPADCTGAGTGGSIAVNVTGGTPPYQSSWTSSNQATGTALTGLAAGTYTITVQDAAGCSGTTTATVGSTTMTLTASAAAPSCNGGNDGSIAVQVSPPGNYTLTSLPAPAGSFTTGNGIFNLPAGAYSVTATDAQGCSRTSSVTVGNPAGNCCVAATDNNYRRILPNQLAPNLHVISASGSWSGKIFVPDNMTVRVAANVTFDVTEADVVFGECAAIELLSGARLRANQSVFRSCDDTRSWQGIRFRGTSSGTVSGSTFKNANIAIAFNGNTSVRIEGNQFIDSAVGLRYANSAATGAISGNRFFIDSRQINWCTPGARPYTGISVAGGSMNAPITNNTFVSTAQAGFLTGIALTGGTDAHITANRFTDNLRAFTANQYNDIHFENNICEVTRDLPLMGTWPLLSQVDLTGCSHVDLFGNTFSSYLQPLVRNAAVLARAVSQPSRDVQAWGNLVRGFSVGLRFDNVLDSRIVSNTVDQPLEHGIYLFDGDGMLASCNRVEMGISPGFKPVGIYYEDDRPGIIDAHHRILNNCVTNTNTAIYVRDLLNSAADFTAMPVIENNYLYNYTGTGLLIAGMNGNLGLTGTGVDAGRNSFITNLGSTQDIYYDPWPGSPPAIQQIVAAGNFFSRTAPQVQNVQLLMVNTHASNTACGKQVLADNQNFLQTTADCLPQR